jgi:hypothetical protein
VVLCEPGKENGSTAELVLNVSLISSKKGLGNEEVLQAQLVRFDVGHSRRAFELVSASGYDQYHGHVFDVFEYSVVGTLSV